MLRSGQWRGERVFILALFVQWEHGHDPRGVLGYVSHDNAP